MRIGWNLYVFLVQTLPVFVIDDRVFTAVERHH